MTGVSGTQGRSAVVIGASTAGLFAAYQLARGGIRVQLFDELEGLGPPARTLILTSRVNDILGYVPSHAVLNRTGTIELFSSRRSLTIRLSEPDLIVERARLVQLLAEKAAAAGAAIHLGCRFARLEPDGDELVLHFERTDGQRVEPVRTRTVIGADGVASRVAREAGLDGRRTLSLLQARVALPPWAKGDSTQVWFDPQRTPYFYWLVPESTEHAVVGLIAERPEQAREGLHRFLEARSLEPLAWQAAQVPFSGRTPPIWRRRGECRILLVGDAAGQVKVTTVGGAVTGLWGAQAAVRSVLGGTDYGRELGGLWGELDLHRLVRQALNRFTPADYDGLLSLVDRRMEGILAAHNRDCIAKVLSRTVLAQPRLLLLVARVCMRSMAPTGVHP